MHFLRFELDPAMIAGARAGAALAMGVDHERYRHTIDPAPARVRDALCADLA